MISGTAGFWLGQILELSGPPVARRSLTPVVRTWFLRWYCENSLVSTVRFVCFFSNRYDITFIIVIGNLSAGVVAFIPASLHLFRRPAAEKVFRKS